MKADSVGTSHRTPLKHALMRHALGRVLNATPFIPECSNHPVIIDLCAGDGQSSDSSNTSSPQIIKEEIGKSKSKHGTVYLFEMQDNTYSLLNQKFGGVRNFHLFHKQADLSDCLEFMSDPTDPVFIVADPNGITDMPLNSEFYLKPLPKFTTIFITLGCNVGGLKRLPMENGRDKWFEIARLLDAKQKNHDVILAALDRDASQWGYLFVWPKKWSQGLLTFIAGKKISQHWPKGITAASMHVHGREEVEALFDRLFLTKEERMEHE